MTVIRVLFLFLALHLVISSRAQLQRNYASYTVDNGLAQNTVWDAFQDHKGYMWFGTADGVNRYDGYNMHHYKWNSNDTTTLLGNTAFRFYEDSKQNLWISHNKGVSIYNRAKDCFTNIPINIELFPGNGDRYATVLGEDKQGRIWCISGFYELVCLSNKDFSVIKRIRFTQSRFPLSSVRSSVTCGKFIIGYLNDSATTWFRLNTETDKVDVIHGPSSYTGYIMAYNDSTICAFDRKNIYLYHIHKNTFTSRPVGGVPNSFSNTVGATSMVWWQGKIYLGNNSGLYILNPRTFIFEERITSFNKLEKVGFYYIQFLRVDRSGNLWICTNGDGVKCLSPYRNKFKHYNTTDSRNRLVKSISTDQAGNIYTGLYSEGLITYTKNGGVVQNKFGKSDIEQSNVLAITTWRNKLYLVNDRDLKEIDPQNSKELYKTDIFHYQNKGYVAYPHFAHYKDRLYLSADISLLEVQEKRPCRTLFSVSRLDTVITTFQIMNDSIWWVGTTKCLYQFHLPTKELKKLPVDIFVKTICFSSNKKHVWVSGNTGLYLLNYQGELLSKFDLSDGLPDDFIYGILEDKHGHLWMSHNKGMSVYDPENKTFKHYGVKDGLQSNEFNTGAYYKSPEGLLYFGGVNGINIINPDEIIENKNLPRISINQILLGDLPYKSDSAYNEIKHLQLSYLQNTLSFDFSALEFSQPGDNKYQYKLDGYDNKWIESGTLHFARYANLPPGNYVFKVKAANGDGCWNPEPRELYIHIIPPFWQRSWFYMLELLLALATLSTAFYLYNQRQQRKLKRELELQQKLEQERLRISRDLHDNVGAQLSFLITNVDWMLKHPELIDEAEEKQRLQALSEAGRNAILTLRQTIWAISHNSLSVDDFADRFKQFALKMTEFDKGVQVHFTENILPGRVLSPAIALNLFRVCQEAFNNSLKHAQCKNMYIHFQSTQDFLFSFSIKDDGIGFNPEQARQKGHYGLVNMEARAAETGAVLHVHSTIGQGTELLIELK